MAPIKYYRISKEFLIQNYLNTEKSLNEIALQIGCSRETIRRALIQFKLKPKYKYRGLIKTKKSFNKGNIPWNKNLKYTPEQKKKINTNGLKVGWGYFKGKIKKKTYPNIHYWVRKQKGKAIFCKNSINHKGRFEWANIDHKYKLNLKDYIPLCKACHDKL